MKIGNRRILATLLKNAQKAGYLSSATKIPHIPELIRDGADVIRLPRWAYITFLNAQEDLDPLYKMELLGIWCALTGMCTAHYWCTEQFVKQENEKQEALAYLFRKMHQVDAQTDDVEKMGSFLSELAGMEKKSPEQVRLLAFLQALSAAAVEQAKKKLEESAETALAYLEQRDTAMYMLGISMRCENSSEYMNIITGKREKFDSYREGEEGAALGISAAAVKTGGEPDDVSGRNSGSISGDKSGSEFHSPYGSEHGGMPSLLSFELLKSEMQKVLQLAVDHLLQSSPLFQSLYKFEQETFPNLLFENGERFVNQILENKNVPYIILSETIDHREIPNDLTSEDFDVVIYELPNGVEVMKAQFPSPGVVDLCHFALAFTDDGYQSLRYFTVEKLSSLDETSTAQEVRLGERRCDGTHLSHGEFPLDEDLLIEKCLALWHLEDERKLTDTSAES